MVRALVLLAVLTAPALADDATPVVRLRTDVIVHDAQVRWMDLSLEPLASDLARTVVMPAPAPGHERTWTRKQLLREIVRSGSPVVPRLIGGDTVRVQRAGGRVAPDVLRAALSHRLAKRPPPPGALDHEYEILRLPSVRTDGGVGALRLEGEGPRVGRGTVAFTLGERRLFATVRRSVRVVVVRSREALDAHRPVEFANVVVDTLWTDDRRHLDRALDADQIDGSWMLVRSVPGGHVIRHGDVRATPVVHRGEMVRWIVESNGLRVEVRARSRGDGAVGEWISVESPFDGRLRRVVVTSPGRVANHPPPRLAEGDAVSGMGGRP